MTSWTSPRPSAMTLPISVVTVRARSSFFRRKMRAASSSSSPRRGAGVFFQRSKASLAWRTASFSSSFVARGNVASVSPVAGLCVSKRFPSDFRHLPPMNRPYSWTIVFAGEARPGQAMTLSWDPRGTCGTPRPPGLRIADDGAGSLQEAIRHDVGRPRSNFGGEAPPPCLRPDPCGPTTERAARLYVHGLVADHPCGSRAYAQVAGGGEQHPGSRLATRAVREHVVRAIVDLRDLHARLPEPREHPIVDLRQLRLREQLPSGGVLVRHDHELPTTILKQPHALNRTGQELELVRPPYVPGPPAVDHAVSIEEHRRSVRTANVRRSAVAVHTQGESRLVRLKEEVDEGPFRERVSSEGQRLVHGEPPDVLDFVRLQAARVGSDVALIHESQGVRRLAGEPGYV